MNHWVGFGVVAVLPGGVLEALLGQLPLLSVKHVIEHLLNGLQGLAIPRPEIVEVHLLVVAFLNAHVRENPDHVLVELRIDRA